jgi:hypothetical protein
VQGRASSALHKPWIETRTAGCREVSAHGRYSDSSPRFLQATWPADLFWLHAAPSLRHMTIARALHPIFLFSLHFPLQPSLKNHCYCAMISNYRAELDKFLIVYTVVTAHL